MTSKAKVKKPPKSEVLAVFPFPVEGAERIPAIKVIRFFDTGIYAFEICYATERDGKYNAMPHKALSILGREWELLRETFKNMLSISHDQLMREAYKKSVQIPEVPTK